MPKLCHLPPLGKRERQRETHRVGAAGPWEKVWRGALPAPRGKGLWESPSKAVCCSPGAQSLPRGSHTPHFSSQPLPSSISMTTSWSLAPSPMSRSVGPSLMLAHLPRQLVSKQKHGQAALGCSPSLGTRVICLLCHLQMTFMAPSLDNPHIPPIPTPEASSLNRHQPGI